MRMKSNTDGTFFKFHTCLFVFLMFAFCSSAIQAQSKGQIRGTVSEASSGALLPSANVGIVGTATGVATNINGEFSLPNLKPGTYTIKVMYMGYMDMEQNVTVKPGKTSFADFALSSIAIQGEQVIVTAQRQGQLASVNQQIRSERLVNVVSAERMREVPDANAAESVARLPGISITRSGGEGSSVIIRGLSAAYNTIKMNGITLPSTSSGGRGTSIMNIASENLAGMEVVKSATADMDADHIGGSLNMILSKASAKADYSARLFGSYNAMENDLGQFKGFLRVNDRFFNGKLGLQASINGEKRNRGRDVMSASYFQKNVFGTDEIYYEINSASISDLRETRQRYGGSLIFDYSQGNNEFQLSSIFNYATSENLSFTHSYSGGMGHVSPRYSESNSFLFNNVLEGKHSILGFDVNWKVAYARNKSQNPLSTRTNFNETHVSSPNVKLDAEDFLAKLPNDSLSNLHTAGWGSSENEENKFTASLDLKYPLKLGKSLAGYFKFGGKYVNTKKDRMSKSGGCLSTHLGAWTAYGPWIEHGYDPGKVLGGRTEIGIVLDPMRTVDLHNWAKKNVPEWTRKRKFSDSGDTNLSENISAAYAMFSLKYKDLIRFIPGIRYESENNYYTGSFYWQVGGAPDYTGSVFYWQTANRKRHYFFPMVHLQIKPTKWFDLRMAYTETISRPGYSRMIPFERRSDYNLSPDISVGMPALKPALSKNIDIYANSYASNLGLFGCGFFYKEINDFAYGFRPYILDAEDAAQYGLPIDGDNRDLNQYTKRWVSMSANLPGTSYVRGMEFDFQPNLSWLPGLLSGIIIHANYTRIWSASMLPKRESIYDPKTYRSKIVVSWRNERLPMQADELMNLSFGYEIGGFSARLSYNHQGGYLSGVGVIAAEDRYIDARDRWDFTLKQDIGDKLTLYLNGVNLTDAPDQVVQAQTRKFRSIAYFGSIYDFGVQYKF